MKVFAAECGRITLAGRALVSWSRPRRTLHADFQVRRSACGAACAVFYQLHVKSFADSNGDGIGDFVGLTSKLDHLAALGVDCLWVQPMYPSPFRDDGYDISDYTSVHPSWHAAGVRDVPERSARARPAGIIELC